MNTARSIGYDIALGHHRGMGILGPQGMGSGPGSADIEAVHKAMEEIDRIARKNGLQLRAIVLEKSPAEST